MKRSMPEQHCLDANHLVDDRFLAIPLALAHLQQMVSAAILALMLVLGV
jgi:hypothetical protein